MPKKYYFFQNKIKEAKNVRLNPNDLGLLRGYGVFDFLRTFQGKPFLLSEHLKRFQNSARLLNLKIPVYNQNGLKQIVSRLLSKNRFKEATVRLVLTGGVSKDSLSVNCQPSFFIMVEPLYPFPQEYYTKGIKLITLEYQREIPRAKTLNYLFALKNQPQMQKAQAQEMLYISQGNVLECSMSNFFIFKNNTLITPQEDILLGTTRNLVLKLARPQFKIQERRIRVNELKQAQEAFITATLKEVMPVIKIDHLKIRKGKVGEKTKIIMNLLKEYIGS